MTGTPTNLLEELEPVVAENLDRHLSMAQEWHPHDYIPWSRGRDFALLGGEDWAPEQSQLSETAKAAMFTNLLTEDNLPSYHREIATRFGRDGEELPEGAHRLRRVLDERLGAGDQPQRLVVQPSPQQKRRRLNHRNNVVWICRVFAEHVNSPLNFPLIHGAYCSKDNASTRVETGRTVRPSMDSFSPAGTMAPV